MPAKKKKNASAAASNAADAGDSEVRQRKPAPTAAAADTAATAAAAAAGAGAGGDAAKPPAELQEGVADPFGDGSKPGLPPGFAATVSANIPSAFRDMFEARKQEILKSDPRAFDPGWTRRDEESGGGDGMRATRKLDVAVFLIVLVVVCIVARVEYNVDVPAMFGQWLVSLVDPQLPPTPEEQLAARTQLPAGGLAEAMRAAQRAAAAGR